MRQHRLLALVLVLLLAACSGPQPTPTLPRPTNTVAANLTVITPTAGLAASPTILISTPTGTISLTAIFTATPGGGADGNTGWSAAGSLASGRASQTASLLPNGRVLVVGGETNATSGQSSLARAEIYDFSTNRWSDAGSLASGRRNQTATVLPNGQVVIIGGELTRSGSTTSATTPSAEAYDSASNSWRSLAPAATSRSRHTATLLPDGRILVVGGISVSADGSLAKSVSTAEIYDPASNTWSSAGSLAQGRSGHTATLLPDGRVVIVGGESISASGSADLTASSEIFDPRTGTWSPSGPLTTGREGHTATLLASGKILVVGGQTDLSRGGNVRFVSAGQAAVAPSSSAELFDPQTNSWSPVASLATERAEHTTTLLPDGQVLVVGGIGKASDAPLATAERYDPINNRWLTIAAPTARASHTATLLPDGSVLVVGGKGSGGTYLASAERYTPRATPPATPSASPSASPSPSDSPSPIAVPSSSPTPTRTPTTAPANTSTPTRTATPVTPGAPTATATYTPTNTPILPTSTYTPTNTPIPPTATSTSTNTPRPPTATNTPTNTPRPPTPTSTRTPTPVPQPGTVFGTVRFCGSACFPAQGVTVTAGGKQTTTNSDGGYVISGIGPGPVTVVVYYAIPGAAGGAASKDVTVPPGGRVQANFDVN